MDHALIFKGGTCLNKCLFGYYRLSEDLDFIHIHSGNGNRNQRKKDFNDTEKLLITAIDSISGFIVKPADKFDLNRQFRMDVGYNSFFMNETGIKIEVTHRNPIQKKPVLRTIGHQFKHPITGVAYESSDKILCIDPEEASAEKIRACCTRKNPAIRDFFDLWYIQHYSGINFRNASFRKLVGIKLSEADLLMLNNESVDILERQIREELIPTLNKKYDFNLLETVSFARSFTV